MGLTGLASCPTVRSLPTTAIGTVWTESIGVSFCRNGRRLPTGQMVHTEKHTSQGRIDSVVETPEHVHIFEFKVDKTVEEALEQIEQSGYARPYAGDLRTLHKIGAVFSTKTRTLSDWREGLGR